MTRHETHLFVLSKMYLGILTLIKITGEKSVGNFKSTKRGGELVLDNFNLNHFNQLLHI